MAIGLAGTREDEFGLTVTKRVDGQWTPVTYDGHPINWVPTNADLDRILTPNGRTEIQLSVPPLEVLASRADEINRFCESLGSTTSRAPAWSPPQPPGCRLVQGASTEGAPPVYRTRQRSYRILYIWDDDTVTVLDIGHRRDIYRQSPSGRASPPLPASLDGLGIRLLVGALRRLQGPLRLPGRFEYDRKAVSFTSRRSLRSSSRAGTGGFFFSLMPSIQQEVERRASLVSANARARCARGTPEQTPVGPWSRVAPGSRWCAP